MTYNGWHNWDTWNSYNWLTSDEGTYHRVRANIHNFDMFKSIVKVIIDDINNTHEESINLELIDYLELWAAFKEDE